MLLFVATISLAVAEDEGENSAAAAPQPRRVLLDRVVAVVGNSSILLSDVHDYVLQIEAENRRQNYTSDRDPKAQAMEDLMIQKLLANQARIDSVEVNLASISTQVESQVAQMAESAGGIKELELAQNMEIFNIRDVMRRSMEEHSYAQAMKDEVESSVKVVPGEVELYYNSHDRDSLPMIGEMYRYAQITRFPKSKDEARRRVVERLVDMRQKIIKGEAKFTSLAQMYSVDPGSAFRGGEMEPQPASAFVPSFAEALQMLKPGQISEVVESDFGYHIIELIDSRGSLYHCRHILLRPSYSAAELMEPINFLDSLAGEIRRDSISFEQAAKEFSHDPSSKMNGGIVTNHDLLERYNAYDAKLTVTKFLKEDFGARGYKSLDDLAALSRLKEGEISEAYTTEDVMGNQLSKIVKLVEVFPAHRASLEEDYIELEGMALVAKQKRVMDEWLERYIRSTYIYIDPSMRDLEFKHKGWVK